MLRNFEKIPGEIFRTQVQNKLNKQEYQEKRYRDLINTSFDFDREEDIYELKTGLSDETLENIRHILKTIEFLPLETLEDVADQLRDSSKKYTLLYAYNGVGKTRLSVAFKNKGKQDHDGDTIYYNAFTEDLFSWENDLPNDAERHLIINLKSHFFDGLPGLDIANKIRPILRKYADFNFVINFENGTVVFERTVVDNGENRIVPNIKVSRGEENIFIWCFFSAIVQLIMDGEPRYNWVKYIYIDDPISSLDDNNAIAVAHYLAKMIKSGTAPIKTVISTHHSLFYNVLCNEFKNSTKLLLRKRDGIYQLKNTTDTPFIYHISIIEEIQKAINEDRLVNYHFTVLRNILEKSANFHGFDGFENLIVFEDDDEEKSLHHRYVQIFNHGGYSLFEPTPISDDNKERFIQIFENFKRNYKFNNELFPVAEPENTEA